MSKLLLDVSGDTQTASEDDEPSPDDEEDPEEEEAAKTREKANDKLLAGLADKQTRKQSSADEIVNRNPFCPTCAPIDEQPLLASAEPQFAGETLSSLRLQVLATMMSDDPTWSMASIRDLDNDRLGPYTANEQVRPGVTILAVEYGRVVLLNQGRREFIPVGSEPPKVAPKPVSAPASKPKPTSKPGGRSVEIEGASQAIDCSSANSCTVDRKFVDKLIKNPQQLMSQVRMKPVTRDGETQGFQVSGVRNGSLVTMLGLENGDILSEVNGSKLGDFDDALAMYQKLRRAKHLSVTVSRGGALITKEISIK